MKKSIAWISIIAVLVMFSSLGCAKNTADISTKPTDKGTKAAGEIQSGQNSSGEVKLGDNPEGVKSEETQPGSTNSSVKTTNTETQQSQNTENSGVTVISKSDNVYSDAQKQQTLEDLTSEIDKLIDSIESLDDVQDSELSFE